MNLTKAPQKVTLYVTFCGALEMQPTNTIKEWLEERASPEHYLFQHNDFRSLFPKMSDGAFKTLLSRAVKQNILERVCRSLYTYKPEKHSGGNLLFHTASYLRSNDFNYLSLESVLSESGIISQIPIHWITIMSSGRSSKVSCGKFGTIEFIHTDKKASELSKNLIYDSKCKLWRADIPLAIRDYKKTRRDLNLIHWDHANEYF